MEYTTLGRTGLKVSVAGMGCGGFSRLGLSSGASEAEAADVVRTALDLGVNYIDTAEAYETEGAVGAAIAGRDRAALVVATKGRIARVSDLYTTEQIAANIDASLRRLRTDYIDIYQVHGPRPGMYEHMVEVVLPVLIRAREAGKIRHIGLSEFGSDAEHELLLRAFELPEVETMLVAFHMMHQTARRRLLPAAAAAGTGIIIMYAVRNLFARPELIRQTVADLAASGKLPAELADRDNPLDFLLGEGGAESVIEAAYRFVRHEPGVNVVVFGTGKKEHVRSNVASILKPALPDAVVARLHDVFGNLSGVGLDRTPTGLRREAEWRAEKSATGAQA